MGEQRDYHEKISRLPGLPRPLDDRIKASFEDLQARGSDILNLHLLGAHAPELAVARKPFIQALRSACHVPRIYREIAITRAAQLIECEYEEHHHKPFCIQCGLSEEATDAIARWQQSRHLFDAKQLGCSGVCRRHVWQQG